MKNLIIAASAAVILVGCQTSSDGNKAAEEAFKTNSKTVIANLEGWQAENLDYSMYSPDFVMRETVFGAEKDSISLEEMKAADKEMWDRYDFKLLTSPPALLPGVNTETGMLDGSVRHYSDWEVILPATDSTEARSGVIKLYESFDFDSNGKILYQQVYGDFTGLMMYLNQ